MRCQGPPPRYSTSATVLEISLARVPGHTIITYTQRRRPMAGRADIATPKIRSRKDGAAIALDDVDRSCST